MTREELVASAARLSTPADRWVEEFSQKREALAAAVNQVMSNRPDLAKLVGPDGKQMSLDNNRNFSLFMESLLTRFQAEVLVDTVLWVFRTYRAHGFQTIYWPANLSTWREALEHALSVGAQREILPFYNWLITNIPAFVRLTETTPPGGVSPADEPPG
ncbi:MAG: hypothetical protein ACLFPD_03640 [Desulfosudaceae bacterium]